MRDVECLCDGIKKILWEGVLCCFLVFWVISLVELNDFCFK